MDENRARAFFEDYRRFLEVFDHVSAMRTAMERMELYILVMAVLLASVVAGSVVAMTLYAMSKACRDPYRFPTPKFSPVRTMRGSSELTTVEARQGPFAKVAAHPSEATTAGNEVRL